MPIAQPRHGSRITTTTTSPKNGGMTSMNMPPRSGGQRMVMSTMNPNHGMLESITMPLRCSGSRITTVMMIQSYGKTTSHHTAILHRSLGKKTATHTRHQNNGKRTVTHTKLRISGISITISTVPPSNGKTRGMTTISAGSKRKIDLQLWMGSKPVNPT